MAGHAVPYFQNDRGHATVAIGVKEFMCIGATPPYDHPHVFLDMGDEAEIVCPYCSTHYGFDAALGVHESRPPGSAWRAEAA